MGSPNTARDRHLLLKRRQRRCSSEEAGQSTVPWPVPILMKARNSEVRGTAAAACW